MKVPTGTGGSGGIGASTTMGSVIASLLSQENRWINPRNIKVAGGYII